MRVAEDGSALEDADTHDEPDIQAGGTRNTGYLADDNALQDAESRPRCQEEDAGLPAEDMTAAEQVIDPITAEDTTRLERQAAAEEMKMKAIMTQA